VPEVVDQPRWQEAAHPTARLVAEHAQAGLARQLAHLDSLDLKASFLVASGAAVMAGFLAALAARPPGDPHVQDVAALAALLLLVSIIAGCVSWWPRTVQVSPDPRGLREHHFNDREVDVLQRLADQAVLSYEENRQVEDVKVTSIRIACFTFPSAIVLGVIAVFLSAH
jgi:hypothetical protein